MVVFENQRLNIDGRLRFSKSTGDLRPLFATIGSHGQSLTRVDDPTRVSYILSDIRRSPRRRLSSSPIARKLNENWRERRNFGDNQLMCKRNGIDQNPEDLSRTLRITFEGREIYKRYLSFLDGDVTRAKASFGVLVSYIYFSASVYWTQHLSAVFM